MLRKFKIGFFLSALLIASHAHAACPTHTTWEGILKANVDKAGYVDYDGIRTNKGGDLYEYLSFLEIADLKDCSEAERFAFWINAYNAHMIKLVLARPSMKKVDEDFPLFDQKFKVARRDLSLNDIEHRVIRSDPKKGGPIEGVSLKVLDPRIHFALVCAAIDCPKLLNRAYTGNSLEGTLQANAVQFANSPKHLRLEDKKLVVSKLMDWYEADFAQWGGAANYLASLTDPSLRPDASDIDGKLKTDFPRDTTFKYDWTLNSVKNKPAAAVPNKQP